MHDQRKAKEELDEKQRAFVEEKISTFRRLYDEVFQCRREGRLDREVLKLLDVLLEVSPEQYTLFGYRRAILLHAWAEEEATSIAVGSPENPSNEGTHPLSPPESLKQRDLLYEFQLNSKVLQKDFKVYSAFVHRRWIIDNMPDAAVRADLLAGEVKRCEALLKLDERNFHAWGYRRWVTSLLRTTSESAVQSGKQYDDEDEWKFTTSKINQNFSNYSAWHNRALLVGKRASELPSQRDGEKALHDLCNAELDLAIKALYCDPHDQSAWLYTDYILDVIQRSSASPQGDGCEDTNSSASSSRSTYSSAVAKICSACDELRDCQDEEEDNAATSACEGSVDYIRWMQWSISRKHSAVLGDGVAKSWGSVADLAVQLQGRDKFRAGMYRELR